VPLCSRCGDEAERTSRGPGSSSRPVNSLASGHVWLAVFAIAALATGNIQEAFLLILADIAHQLHQMRADARDYSDNQDQGDP